MCGRSCSKMRSEAVNGGPWTGSVHTCGSVESWVGPESVARLAPNWEEAQLEASHTLLRHRYDRPLKWEKKFD
jgi:hypothetical protein